MLLVTWNVNGIRARWDELNRLVGEVNPDILCLQEIKATAAQVPEPLTGLPGYHSHYHGGPGGYSGVSVHVKRDLAAARPALEIPAFEFESRIAIAKTERFDIASTYVPNGGKDYSAKLRFLEGLAELCAGR